MTDPHLKQSAPKGLNFYVMGKYLVLAVITVAYIVFVWNMESPSKPVAKYDTEIRPLTDLDRDCGDLEGQATYRLNRPGSKIFTEVHAKSYWNAAGIIFEKGATYNIQVFNHKTVTWKDASQKPAPDKGWWPEKGAPIGSFDWITYWLSEGGRYFGYLRVQDKKLFVLMGVIYGKCVDGRVCAKHFPIKNNNEDFTAPEDGEFCAYANDLSFMYGNNEGSLVLRIMRK